MSGQLLCRNQQTSGGGEATVVAALASAEEYRSNWVLESNVGFTTLLAWGKMKDIVISWATSEFDVFRLLCFWYCWSNAVSFLSSIQVRITRLPSFLRLIRSYISPLKQNSSSFSHSSWLHSSSANDNTMASFWPFWLKSACISDFTCINWKWNTRWYPAHVQQRQKITNMDASFFTL